ncbi:MAG: aspartate ammonia-lyase [Ignavibacteriota bacterium]|nr:MAG: aspartate ammonia-lyase [Chlorobiota bacterium]MBE7477310.1 aspartate ammonia-lyase [Ignavibacteriales bacterium]MBL1122710.1 aspartate ammonia-lyase [Ignavibacteriota bacterium]MCE7856208.1 aspartate ammonia-lyase [Ignavibacteria bacterium CHB3]MEB2296481.1 aspartate ammonia-lyase [Ignavibacteria bacterium]
MFLPAILFAQDSGFRIEHDLLGDKQIPNDAYYGVQTMRALENFQISGQTTKDYPELVNAFVLVKLAAAKANYDSGALPKYVLDAVEKACKEVLAGKYHDQFLVDLYQGGAGTSANMNVNEVLANIALELSGKQKGDYAYIEPHDHLNMSQSTNDSYPTSLHVAIILMNDKMIPELNSLIASFEKKGKEFENILKMGRTELQDAVPMTLGQEFNAFASQLKGSISELKRAEENLYVINMGGTAIGTKLTAQKGFVQNCAKHLAELTGKKIVPATDLIAATSDLSSFVEYSNALNTLAVRLSKIASDLILLASGPRTGLFEINLPALQPGSSIMPGKVNPVMPELMNLVTFKVMGNNVAVTIAAKTGQLQLNAYEPLAISAILESQKLLTNTMKAFRTSCIDGITANQDVMTKYINQSVGIVTALNPVLGYEKTTELAKEALETGKGILELIREKKLLTEEQIKELLDPKKMTGQ